VTTVLLDSHILLWFDSDESKLSPRAQSAILAADELAVASVTWYELAWLAKNNRIDVSLPLASWLGDLAGQVRTIPLTPAIALAAVLLPESFPRDPTDRVIYATAIEHGYSLVTKDEQLRRHRHSRPVTIW
jgi:PIN domain nuclease of toxin-antitoxin system